MRVRIIVLFMTAVLVATVVPGPASSEQGPKVEIIGSLGTTPQWAIAAAAVGTDIYLFGGACIGCPFAGVSTIRKYDTLTDTLTTLPAALPGGASHGQAILVGGNIYIFGDPGDCSTFKFNVATKTVTSAGWTHCPYGFSAVTDGRYIYVIGGYEPTRDIWRFDTVTGAKTRMPTQLPRPTAASGAVWLGGAAYIVGGYESATSFDTILRYLPSTGQITEVARLPMDLVYPSVSTDGTSIFISGGLRVRNSEWYGASHDTTYIYSPFFPKSTNNPRLDPDGSLPSGRGTMATAFVAGKVYMFGSYNEQTAQILRYSPGLPDPTATLLATRSAVFGDPSITVNVENQGVLPTFVTLTLEYNENDRWRAISKETVLLDAGAQATYTRTWAMANEFQWGLFYVRAVLDDGRTVTELDETNNEVWGDAYQGTPLINGRDVRTIPPDTQVLP